MSDTGIDMNDKFLKNFPRKNDPYRMEMVYAVFCPNCERKRYLRLNDALRVTVCEGCQRRDAIRSLPLEQRLENIGKHRLSHPSVLEQLVIAYLDGLNNNGWGIDYRREQVIRGADNHPYLVDFVLQRRGMDKPVILEVDGDWVHAQEGRAAFAIRKDEALREVGYVVHRLTESSVTAAIGKFMSEILPSIGEEDGTNHT